MRALTPGLSLACIAVAVAGCGHRDTVPGPSVAAPNKMTLTSPAFDAGARIPTRFTCDGGDVSPPLGWSDSPIGTRELALLVEDPDAPGQTFVHWALFGIGPQVRSIRAGRVPVGARQGRTSGGKASYVGPCPPPGDRLHRYRFSIYALRKRLDLPNGASAQAVRDAVAREAIAQGRLVGRYGR